MWPFEEICGIEKVLVPHEKTEMKRVSQLVSLSKLPFSVWIHAKHLLREKSNIKTTIIVSLYGRVFITEEVVGKV